MGPPFCHQQKYTKQWLSFSIAVCVCVHKSKKGSKNDWGVHSKVCANEHMCTPTHTGKTEGSIVNGI